MTRKVLLISDDTEFKDYLNTVTLTITKLNHQITFTEDIKDTHCDFVIIDFDKNFDEKIALLENLRKTKKQSNKKIISIKSDLSKGLKEQIFYSGCDSVMDKQEFKKAVNHLLVY